MAADAPLDLNDFKLSLRRRVEIRAGDGEPLVVSWQPDALNDAYIRVVAGARKVIDVGYARNRR